MTKRLKNILRFGALLCLLSASTFIPLSVYVFKDNKVQKDIKKIQINKQLLLQNLNLAIQKIDNTKQNEENLETLKKIEKLKYNLEQNEEKIKFLKNKEEILLKHDKLIYEISILEKSLLSNLNNLFYSNERLVKYFSNSAINSEEIVKIKNQISVTKSSIDSLLASLKNISIQLVNLIKNNKEVFKDNEINLRKINFLERYTNNLEDHISTLTNEESEFYFNNFKKFFSDYSKWIDESREHFFINEYDGTSISFEWNLLNFNTRKINNEIKVLSNILKFEKNFSLKINEISGHIRKELNNINNIIKQKSDIAYLEYMSFYNKIFTFYESLISQNLNVINDLKSNFSDTSELEKVLNEYVKDFNKINKKHNNKLNGEKIENQFLLITNFIIDNQNIFNKIFIKFQEDVYKSLLNKHKYVNDSFNNIEQLSNKYKELNKTILKLSDEKRNLEEKVKNLNIEKDSIDEYLKINKNAPDINIKIEARNSIIEDIQNKEIKVNEIGVSIQDNRNKINDLKLKINNALTKNEELVLDKNSLLVYSNLIESILNKKDIKISNLIKEMEIISLENKLHMKKEEQIERLLTRRNNEQEELKKSITILENNITEKNSEIKFLNDEILRLNNELIEKNKNIETLNEKINENEQKIIKLQNEIIELNNNINELKITLNEKDALIQELRNNNENLKNNLLEKNKIINNLNELNLNNNNRIDSLNNELKEKIKKNNELLAENLTKEEKINEFKIRINTLVREIESWKSTNQSKDQEIISLKQKIRSVVAKIKEIKNDLDNFRTSTNIDTSGSYVNYRPLSPTTNYTKSFSDLNNLRIKILAIINNLLSTLE